MKTEVFERISVDGAVLCPTIVTISPGQSPGYLWPITRVLDLPMSRSMKNYLKREGDKANKQFTFDMSGVSPFHVGGGGVLVLFKNLLAFPFPEITFKLVPSFPSSN